MLTPSPLPPPSALRAATTPTAPVDGPHPRDLPENQYSYRPPPQPPSDHPASQPPPAPPTFHVTHSLIPFSSADSHSGFAALSHAVSPFSHIHPIHPPNSPLCFSFHHSHPHKPPAHHHARPPRAITLPVSPFEPLRPSLRPPVSFVRYPSLIPLCPRSTCRKV